MNDEVFNRFSELVMNKLYIDNKFKDEDTSKITEAFQYIRRDPDILISYFSGKKDTNEFTFWQSGCKIIVLIEWILGFDRGFINFSNVVDLSYQR